MNYYKRKLHLIKIEKHCIKWSDYKTQKKWILKSLIWSDRSDIWLQRDKNSNSQKCYPVGMNYYNSRILMGKLILWWEKSDTKGTDYRTKSSNRDSSSGNEKVAWSGHLLSFDQTKKEIISYVRICSSFSFFIFRFIS